MHIEEFIEPTRLRSICDIEVSEKVFNKLTQEETRELKDELAEKQVFLAKRKGHLKAIQDSFKMLDSDSLLDHLSKLEVVDFGNFGTKSLMKQIADITVMLDEKGSHMDMKLYGIDDYEQGIRIMYDTNGKYSYHRDLSESEKTKPSMFNSNLKIANNE